MGVRFLRRLWGFLLLASSVAASQNSSNKGKDFWFGYGHNVLFTANSPPNAQSLVLYLSAEKATQVNITVNGTGWAQTINLPANTVDFSVELPKSGPNDCRIITEGKFDRGIHISSTEPIVAYAHQYGVQSSGATMLFPQETFGYTYYSVNYLQQSNFPNCYSWIYVIAPEDNTSIDIIPSDTTQGGWLPGQTYRVNLNKGELYNIFGKSTGTFTGKDLSGTKVLSVTGADGKCHPVAMHSGASRMVLCNGDGGEFMQQQMFPASAWGTSYLTFHTVNNNASDIISPFVNFYRVSVSDPTTIVKRNGTQLTGLTNNFFYDFTSDSGDYIQADKPIQVTQYMPSGNQCTGTANPPSGDPEMFILSPLEQGIKSVRYYNTRKQSIDVNYVDLIVHKNGLASLRIDGTVVPPASMVVHPANSDYVFAARRLLGAGAQHSVICDSPFVGRVYGLGSYESYGYNLGAMINNLNGLFQVHNLYNNTSLSNTFTCPKSPFQLTLRLAYKATTIKWEFSKTTGLSTQADTLLTNPVPVDSVLISGRKYFTYRLPASYLAFDTGTIDIPVQATSPEIDHCDKTEYMSYPLEVRRGPVSDFSIQHSGCVSDTALFTATPNPNGYNLDGYIWTHFDNTTDSAQFSRKRFPAGTHPVSLRVIADNGCLRDTTKPIVITQVPNANFGLSSSLCLGDSALITDSASFAGGSITQWYYDFGDGQTATRYNGSAFYHTYAAAGNYTVKHWVITSIGCQSDTAYRTIVMTAKPSASFASSGLPCGGDSLSFTPTAKPPDGASTWFWDFGNGQTRSSADSNPVKMAYIYPQQNIIVKHVVVTAGGCASDTAFGTAFSTLPRPVASFTYNGDTLCTGVPVQFTNSSTLAAGNIVRYAWSFGNDSTAATADPTHNFAQAGIFNVWMLAFSDAGCRSDTAMVPVTISQMPAVDAEPNMTVVRGQAVTLRATASTTGLQHLWQPTTFLDDATLLNPVCNPDASTGYRLTVQTTTGSCTASDTMYVSVLDGVKIPNAFSPNGDGINDIWNITGLAAYLEATLDMYDRYGRQILSQKGYSKPWDGTYKGVPIPAGVYYYILDLRDGSTPKISGSVTIIK